MHSSQSVWGGQELYSPSTVRGRENKTRIYSLTLSHAIYDKENRCIVLF